MISTHRVWFTDKVDSIIKPLLRLNQVKGDIIYNGKLVDSSKPFFENGIVD
jgi:hypothetical protein